MAVTVDWANSIINVARADMTLIQTTPTEIRELDTNAFRLELRDLEDSEEGRPFPVTHDHNEDVLVGGVELADVLIIREPYTITFEDGQYAVYLKGTNNNILERTNKNQVSVNPSNSAGLVNSSTIEYGSYENKVTIDLANGVSGTAFPIGTPASPVNNLTDAKLIADYRGFHHILFIGHADMDVAVDFTDYTIEGQNANLSTINVDTVAVTNNCEFRECNLTGVLDGGSIVRSAMVSDLNYVNGVLFTTMINPGTITLGGSTTAHFLDCYSGVPGTGTPVIDFNGSGNSLAMRNYNGGIKLTNKTGPESVSIDLNSGQCVLSSTVTAGTIVCRGVGKLIDESGDYIYSGTWNGGVTILNETTEASLTQIMQFLGNKVTKFGNTITIYENDGVTVWKQYNLADGERIPV